MKIYEAQGIPRWARPWRYNYSDGSVDVLPIPLCWIVRLLYNIWSFSFRFRRNALETQLAIAYDLGCAHGDGKGHQAGYEAGYEKGITDRQELVSMAAEDRPIRKNPMHQRIAIAGIPKSGKTTLANEMGDAASADRQVLHTDDLIDLGWSESSQAVSEWFDKPGPLLVEGVAVPRGCAETPKVNR